jgi:TIR domain
MHVFVSYSRRDAAFVTRLVSVLEHDGHDVWVDTEDIRGSEEWRASIVRGIRLAEVVLLVISPSSMASPEVDREVAVAAQEGRRIVPIVLTPAPMADGIGYELAGIQQVTFVDRPFDDAVADLRAALTPGDPRARAVPPGRTPARPRRATTRRRLAVGAALAVAVVVGGTAVATWRSDGGDTGHAGSPDTPSSATAATSPGGGGDEAGTDTVSPGSDVWFAGYRISVRRATFDPEGSEVGVDVTITNVQPATADPLAIMGDLTVLEWGGHRATSFCTCSRLPPGASESETLTFSVDGDVDLDTAVLAFGEPEQHRALVPFDGSPPTSEQPTVLDVSGSIDDGAGTTFTVARVDVVPARCSGLSSDLAYVPGPADEVAVVVWGTAVTSATPNVGLGQARLVLPDGTAVGSSSLDGVIYVLEPGQPHADIPVCFAVPSPGPGEYRIDVAATGVAFTSSGLTFSYGG